MADEELLTFEQAIEDSAGRKGYRSVLLGNGFGIDWKYEAFHYRSLHEDADFKGLSVARATDLFDRLGTYDFEVVIDQLNAAADLADLYDTTDGDLPESLRADAQIIRDGLAQVIADRHPDRAQAVTDDEVKHARAFLSRFRFIYTVNYDLLLYWVVNRRNVDNRTVTAKDGFEYPTARGPWELVWKPVPTQGPQRIFHLHGALHYFRRPDGQLEKLRYGISDPLIDQIKARIEGGEYPEVVTEGKTEDKVARIERSDYLRRCHQALAEASGSLFIHGLSLAPNDDHILRTIESEDSKIGALYVSVYGEPDTPLNEELMRRARQVRQRRRDAGGRRLDVLFYRSETAEVWREAASVEAPPPSEEPAV